MSKEKLARRKAANDDPFARNMSNMTTSGAPPAAQPNPHIPQGTGNMMNNPQIGQSMGGGAPMPGKLDQNNPQSPYGDNVFTPEQIAQTGTVGFAERSVMPEFIVPGRGLNNQAYNMQQQPYPETQNMMNAMYDAQQAGERSARLVGQQLPPSYQIAPMGMIGMDLDTAQRTGAVNAGQIPGTAPQQMFNALGLQGMNSVEMAATLGMNPDNGSMTPGSTKTVKGKKRGKA
jgi:hypothetical protein